MKTAAEITEFILKRLGHIYRRPLGYGGTAEGVNQLLHFYHELWVVIVCKEQEYDRVRFEVHEKHQCGASDFPHHFHRSNPGASEGETTEYVATRWMEITERLAVPIPWTEIEKELSCFKDNPAKPGHWRPEGIVR